MIPLTYNILEEHTYVGKDGLNNGRVVLEGVTIRHGCLVFMIQF